MWLFDVEMRNKKKTKSNDRISEAEVELSGMKVEEVGRGYTPGPILNLKLHEMWYKQTIYQWIFLSERTHITQHTNKNVKHLIEFHIKSYITKAGREWAWIGTRSIENESKR